MKLESLRKVVILVLIVLLLSSGTTTAWSNGGFSEDPMNPDYGTHDWIAEHALDYLPEDEKDYILDHMSYYLYGTELPDNDQTPDGIGDTSKQHVYFNKEHDVVDNSSAYRVGVVFDKALSYLKEEDYRNASKYAGIMTHYISDVGVFGHVMGPGTDWGAEEHHDDYEEYIEERISSYESPTFDPYLSFDGSLANRDAGTSTVHLANTSTFGPVKEIKNCTWMDENYDWSNETFRDSAGYTLNYSVNFVADTLHYLAVRAEKETKVQAAFELEGHKIILTGDKRFLNGSKSYSNSGSIVSYNWTIDSEVLDKKITKTGETINYTFEKQGTYTVKLNVTDDKGRWDVNQKEVKVISKLMFSNEVVPIINIEDDDEIIVGEKIYLNASKSYSKNGTILSNDWIIDSEVLDEKINKSGERVSHRFSEEGVYTVRLNVTDDKGHWNFTEKEIIAQEAHSPTYPSAEFTANRTEVEVGEMIHFDAGETTDDDSLSKLTFKWDMGDGTVKEGVEVEHSYQETGKYNVTLTVTDTDGLEDSHQVQITVEEESETPGFTVLVLGVAIGIVLLYKKKEYLSR